MNWITQASHNINIFLGDVPTSIAIVAFALGWVASYYYHKWRGR